MVNTRILEERLGWQQRQEGDEAESSARVVPLPEPRGMAHAPMLQGRVGGRAATGVLPPARREAVAQAWAALPKLAESTDQLPARHGALHSIDRRGEAAAALDRLRSQLMPALQEHGWRRIGVCAPHRGGGATFVAAGLAASIARLDYMRVLLADMDLAAPRLATNLELAAPPGLGELVAGALPPEAVLRRIGDNLALMLNDRALDNAGDIAQSPALANMLRRLLDTLAPDVLLMDMPPLLESGVSTALLGQLDAVLLVADGTRSQARDITDSEALLEGRAPLLGVVLNKSEDRGRRGRN
ncbi:MAG: CpsD/CapB family tyrosine-protein kinase [Pararhodobacter sp.]|nr:CpsD/CapB family tyrosine-protein kinase [Pararhodobacter sp.]